MCNALTKNKILGRLVRLKSGSQIDEPRKRIKEKSANHHHITIFSYDVVAISFKASFNTI